MKMPHVHGARKKNVLVTGGGTGIGYAIAELFVRNGYSVSIVGRRHDVISAAGEKLNALGKGTVLAIAKDIAEDAAAEAIVRQHADSFGNLAALVSAAGIYEQRPFLETTAASWDRILNTNLRGNMLMALAAARQMSAERQPGRIIFIGSVLCHHSEPNTSAYSASKAAIASLTRSLAVDLAAHGIRVNCIAPGWVRTPMAADEIDAVPAEKMGSINPLVRAAAPEEVASLAYYLIEIAPDFLTGQTINIDGGQTIRAPVLA